MLLTTCPECSAQFKVQTEQLNIRQGRVMCGRCRHVFNAFETLARIEDNVQDGVQDSAIESIATTVEAKPEEIEQVSVEKLIASETDAFAPDEKIDANSSNKVFRTIGDLRVQQNINEKNVLLNRSDQNLSHVERSWGWSLGATVLILVLMVQLLYYFRGQIVLAYPQFRPQLAQVCRLVGCGISWKRDKDLVMIESSELVEPPGKPGEYLLSTVIANHSEFILDLPSLDVRLTDSNNQPLLRRVLVPAEYLGRVLKNDEGLAPGTQIYVNLSVAIDKKIAASGYVFDVFYP